MRAFILLKPPLLSEAEGIEWAVTSIEHAFAAGAGCCSVIPTRAGNGIMEQLERRRPVCAAAARRRWSASSRKALRLAQGRVFVDLWDAEKLAACSQCRPARIERLRQMNLRQEVLPAVAC